MQNKIYYLFKTILILFITFINLKCNKSQNILEDEYIKINIYNKHFEVQNIQSYIYWAPYESLSEEYIEDLKNSFISIQLTNHSANKIKLNLSNGNIIDMKQVKYLNGDSVVFFNDGWLPGSEFIIEPYIVIDCGMLWAKGDTISGQKNSESDSVKLLFEVSRLQHGYWNKKMQIPVTIFNKEFAHGDSVSYSHYLKP